MNPQNKQTEKPKFYQLKISLDEVRPPIWRRIQVPGDISLLKLHFIIQIAMGWTNSHLHEFHIEDQSYGTQWDDGWETRDIRDEKEYGLEQIIPGKGFEFRYLYDFGDGWEHTILVEDLLEPVEGQQYPTCLDGARACPPEDVGGAWGYQDFLEAINNPSHTDHEDYLAWIGGKFDPEAFDRERTDAKLKNIDRSEMVRIYQRYHADEVSPELKLYQGISAWVETLTSAERAQLDELPLRRDTVSLLIYLRDHPTKGTQSTGNLPLKAIRAVAAKFVHPPTLDTKIGEREYKLRTEYDVWPIYFIDSLSRVGGLLEGAAGQRLCLTPKGEKFLRVEPPVQVWFLLETWWHHTNWLVAFSFSGMGEQLPFRFKSTTLDHLLMLPVGQPIPFEDFADRLIQSTGLRWSTPDSTYARGFLHAAIERMVISILDDFGVVEREEKEEKAGRISINKLHNFTITKLGKGLLKAVAGGPF